MVTRCSDCARILVDLRKPHVLQRAQLVYRILVRRFRGRVDLQKHLLAFLYERFGVTNGCAHAHVEALADRGNLRVEYWGPGSRRKRIVAVRPPRAPGPRVRPRRRFSHPAEFNALAGPPGHASRLRRVPRQRSRPAT